MKLLSIGALALGAFLAQPSLAGDITASGSGWCDNTSYCDNTDTNTISNNYAGLEWGSTYHDWFAVNLPNVTITSASLSIWNEFPNENDDASSVYSLFAASGIDFGGLVSGSALGAIALSDADTGVSHYVTINLNQAGIAALNHAAGGSFLFGGAVGGFTGGNVNAAFGYTGGTPAAYLTIGTAAAVPVPEPASWALMVLGFGAAGYGLRRRTARRAFA